jgi:phospholipid/cholesterol/gamma-HCH transport system ATP-binding protein
MPPAPPQTASGTAAPEQAGSECPLRFERVTLRFDDVKALDDVSFQVAAGETRVLLGAAGSGKTTLLKAAIGLVRIDSGRIFLLGDDITSVKERELFPKRARVGVLFQEGGLFDSMTVAENVSYPLLNRQSRQVVTAEDAAARVQDMLRFVELEQTLDKLPSELSGGMRRRVGIARAVVTEPPLVLYDSPTAGLDPITANTIMTLIAKERDLRNTANLIVTHRYQDGQLMAKFRYNPHSGHLERVAHNGPEGNRESQGKTVFMVMKEGRVAFEGTQGELEASRDEYLSKFVPKRR